MKVAVTTYNGEIFQHFGTCPEFTVYTIENGEITAEKFSNTGSGHGALLQVLLDHSVDALICGGIGGGARNGLAQLGIELYPGVSGNADEAVLAFAAGTLSYNPNTVCGHHEHGEGHSCAHHCQH
ncbi:MAG: NifB/NifX family molybdenum-iron cluster-binding protein [Methanocorpusculum sp.]|nr:NifB/NifX family molybdenum-iron cluster-binding protein [Methanocorpusculum sp.]